MPVDHIGAPRRAYDVGSGDVAWAADYEAFGRAYEYVPGSADPPAIEVNLRFPGQYLDRETGLHYNHNRYYSPALGRYLTADPLGRKGGDPTSFGYARQSPLSNIDPMGLVILTADNASETAVANLAYNPRLRVFLEELEQHPREILLWNELNYAGPDGGLIDCTVGGTRCLIAWNTAAAIAAMAFSGGWTDNQVVAHELGHAYDVLFNLSPATLEHTSMVLENIARDPGPYRTQGQCE